MSGGLQLLVGLGAVIVSMREKMDLQSIVPELYVLFMFCVYLVCHMNEIRGN